MMTLDGQDELMKLKLRCANLLLGCPLDRKSPGCPFGKARKESVVTRVNWLKSLDAARITAMLTRHEKCMAHPRAPQSE